jgi:hypothetical protein
MTFNFLRTSPRYELSEENKEEDEIYPGYHLHEDIVIYYC